MPDGYTWRRCSSGTATDCSGGEEYYETTVYNLPEPEPPVVEEPEKPIQKNRVFFLKAETKVFNSVFKPGPGWGFFKGCFS
jgi:hypothetical protein